MKGTWDHDRDPLAALRRGDSAPFESFVRTEAATLFGFFRRKGAPRVEAEDLVQEVFLKLYRHAHTYEPRQAFGGFVMRVARNAWIDRRRRRAVRPSLGRGESADEDAPEPGAGERPSPEAGPRERAERREEAEQLMRALGQLPESHQTVFELAVLQELPYAEIAAIVGIPVGTVKSRVFHAVRKLRDIVQPSEERR